MLNVTVIKNSVDKHIRTCYINSVIKYIRIC